jgi:Fur family ferric uptake transcriptional regulator
MDEAAQILKRYHFKNTKLRHAVLTKLMDAATGLSHQDLSKSLELPFDRVTLFRTLSSFEESGIIHKIMDLNGTATYAFTTVEEQEEENHAHFLCIKCDKIFCLEEVFPLQQVKVPAGFRKLFLDVKVKGICKECR